jgi:hypothetical protein
LGIDCCGGGGGGGGGAVGHRGVNFAVLPTTQAGAGRISSVVWAIHFGYSNDGSFGFDLEVMETPPPAVGYFCDGI